MKFELPAYNDLLVACHICTGLVDRLLCLFSSCLPPVMSIVFHSSQAVVAEFYDEVVFTDPYEEFYNTLMEGQRLLPQKKHEHQEHFSTFSDGDTLQRLAAAREWVHNQLRGVYAEIACEHGLFMSVTRRIRNL